MSAVLVTGAASGIGAAIAQQMAKQMAATGARLILLDQHSSVLAEAASLRTQWQGECHGVVFDLSAHGDIAGLVAQLQHEHGPITCLLHAAGVFEQADHSAISPAHWHHLFAVNTFGFMQLVLALAPTMQARRSGTLIYIGSNAATTPRHGMSIYAASKAASQQFLRCIGLELAPCGIRCNCVAPGSTATPMQQQFLGTFTPADIIAGNAEQFRLGIPLQRIAQPEDVAAVACFLATDAARHITLQTITVDGGATF